MGSIPEGLLRRLILTRSSHLSGGTKNCYLRRGKDRWGGFKSQAVAALRLRLDQVLCTGKGQGPYLAALASALFISFSRQFWRLPSNADRSCTLWH